MFRAKRELNEGKQLTIVICVNCLGGSGVAVRLFDGLVDERARSGQCGSEQHGRHERGVAGGLCRGTVRRVRRAHYRSLPDSSVRTDVALELPPLLRLSNRARQPAVVLRPSRSDLLSQRLRKVRLPIHVQFISLLF